MDYRSPYDPLEPCLVNEDGVVLLDTPCLGCDYNLRGAERLGACPECGKPVAESLIRNRLAYADAEWVRSLATGFRFLLLAIVIGFAIGVINNVVMTLIQGTPNVASSVFVVVAVIAVIAVQLPATLLFALGWWKATEPEPNHEPSRAHSRREVARVLMLVAVVAGFIFGVVQGVVNGLMQASIAAGGQPDPMYLAATFAIAGVSVILAGVGLGGQWCMLKWIESLAERAPDLELVRLIGWVVRSLVLLPVVVVGGFCFIFVGMFGVVANAAGGGGGGGGPGAGTLIGFAVAALLGLYALAVLAVALVFGIGWMVVLYRMWRITKRIAEIRPA